jgi:hypothetical protein
VPQREAHPVRASRLALILALAVAGVLALAACGASSNLTAAVSSGAQSAGNTGTASTGTASTGTASTGTATGATGTTGSGTTGTGTTGTGTSTAGNGTASTGTGTVATSTNTSTLPTATTPAATRASVATGSDAPVAPTSTQQGFLGIATELSTVTALAGSSSNLDTPYVQLLRNLSPGAPLLLRLGGDSTDWDWWAVPGMKQPAGIRYTMTPQWGATVKALLNAVGAKALLGVNLELDSKRVAAYEVKQYERYVGSNLIYGFELGNEPELYAAFNYYHLSNGTGVPGRAVGHYSLLDYAKDFSNLATVLAGRPLVGPSSGSPSWLPDLSEMLANLPARLKLVTVHAYPLKHCSPSSQVSVSDFFLPASISGLADSIRAMVQAAAAHGKPLRLDEINGITCGGEAGVSNTFAESLWALNVLPALWQAGVEGVNFQDVDGNLNQVITAGETKSGWSVTVQPEYYGLMAFADIAPAGSHLLKLTDPGYPDFYQYGVKDPDGTRKVVLTNVGASARTVGVSVAGGHGPALIARLTAPSLTATSHTTLGGQHLSASTGALTGHPTYTLVTTNARGVYAVRVPADSAAILTVGS